MSLAQEKHSFTVLYRQRSSFRAEFHAISGASGRNALFGFGSSMAPVCDLVNVCDGQYSNDDGDIEANTGYYERRRLQAIEDMYAQTARELEVAQPQTPWHPERAPLFAAQTCAERGYQFGQGKWLNGVADPAWSEAFRVRVSDADCCSACDALAECKGFSVWAGRCFFVYNGYAIEDFATANAFLKVGITDVVPAGFGPQAATASTATQPSPPPPLAPTPCMGFVTYDLTGPNGVPDGIADKCVLYTGYDSQVPGTVDPPPLDPPMSVWSFGSPPPPPPSPLQPYAAICEPLQLGQFPTGAGGLPASRPAAQGHDRHPRRRRRRRRQRAWARHWRVRRRDQV